MHDQGWGVIPSTSRVSAVSISVRITGICVNKQCSDATSAGRPRNGMTSTHKDGADLRLCVGGTQCCVISAKISHARAQYCCSFLHAGLPPFVCAATARCPPHMLFRECSISTHVTDHTRAEYGCSLAHRRCDSRPRRRRLSVARVGRMSMGLDGGLNEKIASAEPTGGGPWSARELSILDCARKFIQMLHPATHVETDGGIAPPFERAPTLRDRALDGRPAARRSAAAPSWIRHGYLCEQTEESEQESVASPRGWRRVM